MRKMKNAIARKNAMLRDEEERGDRRLQRERDDDERDRGDDQKAAQRRVLGQEPPHRRHVSTDRERRRDERRAGEPEQAAARLVRRVEPRREDGEQRERPVGVVQPVAARGSRRESSRSPSPTCAISTSARARARGRARRPRGRAGTTRAPRALRPTSRRARRMPATWCVVSIGQTLQRRNDGRGRQACTGFRADERQRRHASSSRTSVASRSSSTSIPRTTRPAARRRPARSATRTTTSSERGAVVLGVSPDNETSHVKFKEKYGLPFTLLADPEHEVAEEYGDVGREEELRQDVHGRRALDVPDRQRGARCEGDAAREARHARRAGARGAAGLARLRFGFGFGFGFVLNVRSSPDVVPREFFATTR